MDAGAHANAGTLAAEASGRWAGAFADPSADGAPIPIDVLPPRGVGGWLKGLPPAVVAWLTTTHPALARPTGPPAGTIVVVPSLGQEGGAIARALLVVAPGGEGGVWAYAGLPAALPAGMFELVPADGAAPIGDGPALGWALGAYSWDRYKKNGGAAADAAKPTLVWPAGADRAMVGAAAAATYLARDLVSEPASALGPAELEAAVRGVAAAIPGATVDAVVGDDLLSAGWPMVHAVGRAAAVGREPRLIELRWTGPEAEDRPEVVLVGKGVVFDTGGVNVKTTAGMRTMKKGASGLGGARGVDVACLASRPSLSVSPFGSTRLGRCATNGRLALAPVLSVLSLTPALCVHCTFAWCGYFLCLRGAYIHHLLFSLAFLFCRHGWRCSDAWPCPDDHGHRPTYSAAGAHPRR